MKLFVHPVDYLIIGPLRLHQIVEVEVGGHDMVGVERYRSVGVGEQIIVVSYQKATFGFHIGYFGGGDALVGEGMYILNKDICFADALR